MRLPLLLCALALALPAAPALAAPAAKKKALRVTLTAQSHHPKLGHTWTYRVRVVDARTRRPVACTIHLQFTFGGMAVGEVGRHRVKHGVWKETIPAHGRDAFPPAAVGPKLTLRATVTARGYRKAVARWAIVVVR